MREARQGVPAQTRFGPEPVAVLAAVIALLGSLPAAVTWPWLRWLPLLPVLAAVWVLRAGVVVRPDGLQVCNGLRRRLVPWADVEGFDVPRRGPVRLRRRGGTVPLLAVPRRDLRDLARAAGRVQGS